ncbi:hypothetical protein KQ693_12835 (plasmid) [Thermus sp. PS18]|uniref:hypothetical protein n=1 Tax=Thermus sp. PS18 TaxID=2849039 RepID=UPI002264DC94|nr:hypothetical protein [Thermus sp. PS18]UZX16825.1 hypothetical protein KQ693_12835 [Thermus sp. PS18]
MACPMCGGRGRILVRLPGGEEVETACLECLEREWEWEDEDPEKRLEDLLESGEAF